MLKTLSTIAFILVSSTSWSQMTPQKVDTSDTRAQKEYFSVIFQEDKKSNVITLSVNSGGSFHVFYSVNNELISSKKVPTQTAQKIDKQFADKFITMKYMLEGVDKPKCSSNIGLSMRGEIYRVCDKDSRKASMAQELINKLKKII